MLEFDEYRSVLALRRTINFDDKGFGGIPPPSAVPVPAGTVVPPVDPNAPPAPPLPVGLRVAKIAKGTFLLSSYMEVEVPFVGGEVALALMGPNGTLLGLDGKDFAVAPVAVATSAPVVAPAPNAPAPAKFEAVGVLPVGRLFAATRDVELWLIRSGAPTAGRATFLLTYVLEHPAAALAPGWQEYPKQVAGVIVHTREQEDEVRRVAHGEPASEPAANASDAPLASTEPTAAKPYVPPMTPAIAPSTGPGAPPVVG
jgi:hypothetical protein